MLIKYIVYIIYQIYGITQPIAPAQGLAPARKKYDPSTENLLICTRIIFLLAGASQPLWPLWVILMLMLQKTWSKHGPNTKMQGGNFTPESLLL